VLDAELLPMDFHTRHLDLISRGISVSVLVEQREGGLGGVTRGEKGGDVGDE
jgi:hypothetical protein